jgi:hypothetical protein
MEKMHRESPENLTDEEVKAYLRWIHILQLEKEIPEITTSSLP